MFAEIPNHEVVPVNICSLNPYIKCERAQQFEEKPSARIVGQENAWRE